ncbi:MAG: penicillin acylase family protein, partial [Alphaproteobacteria bacterium]|nr:penicillin acylase family protein [Alphaproteobacteria bacterium]
TDADAVFGMIYAQAEDDFGRIEDNYLTALGRRAEAEGEGAIWSDLRQRLFIDPETLKADYASSPAWLKTLMDAWADGLNAYLAAHPTTHPKVITRFEPWMALAFSEGSIGGDIERASLKDLAAFYGGPDAAAAIPEAPPGPKEPSGSNGIAIAPSNTRDHHALLLINPHTSFFFRSELQMTSDEGLNVYGAATWGQFFIYQGFNPHLGWMHTSSGVDNVDRFAEQIIKKDGRLYFRFGSELRPVRSKVVTLAYRRPDGTLAQRSFTTYRTHHGPVVARRDGTWIALDLMNTPVPALEQSFLRTKAATLADYLKIAAYRANSSNNTLLADDQGDIAYLHPQFIPIRDDRFDYTQIVNGADPSTDWRGLTPLDQIPQAINPPSGYVFNTNDSPWMAAGPGDSPKASAFPRYMDRVGENPRGLHALRLLEGRRDFTLEGLMKAAFDPYLPAFPELLSGMVSTWGMLAADDPNKERLESSLGLLRSWDYRWSAGSRATTLAVYWAEALRDRVEKDDPDLEGVALIDRMAAVDATERLDLLDATARRLDAQFGTIPPWGEVNRFQRLDDSIVPHFSDAGPSIPVPFTSSQWGSLASFGARTYPGTKKRYGTSGNSFVAVVEFGPRVRALAVTAGGESGHPDSRHFDDEAERYASGDLRAVYFWPEDLKGHTEATYHPAT